MNGVQLSCECEYVDPMTLSPGDPLFAFITFAHRILIAYCYHITSTLSCLHRMNAEWI